MTWRLRGDDGVVGGLEAMPFGFLVFVVGALLVANVWAVVDAKFAVTMAAREAVRVYVEAADQPQATRRSSTVARDVVAEHGRRPELAHVRIEHLGSRSWARCTRVVVTVSYPVPALTLPWVGGFGHATDVRAEHSEIIDPFRDGLPGEGTC